MRNLILFLGRYHFFFLFLILEVLSFYLVFRNNNYHNTLFFNSSNKVAANILGTVYGIREFIYLRTVNESLSRENAELLTMMPQSFYDLSGDSVIINDTLYRQKYYYLTAKVVNNSINKRNNYLTLAKGAAHGIAPEMGVISSDGVVGIVKDVSQHYCTVRSLLHKDVRISAQIKNSRYFGSLVWNGFDPTEATLLEIPKNAVFNIGDTVITTMYSQIFPENIMIGKIKSSLIEPGDNFFKITVDLSVDYGNLSHVHIIENMMKQEIKELEGRIRD